MQDTRIAGYVRVSRVAGRTGDSFHSPTDQDNAIRGDVRASERLVDVEHELDASGGSMSRAKLQRLIERIRLPASDPDHIDGIVCARLDRFARTVRGGLEAIEQISEAGGFVRFIADGIDTSASRNSMGKLQLQILLAVAEWQRSVASEYIEESKENAVARGVHIAGRVPFGYRRPHRGAALELDEPNATAIRKAFELRATGATIGECVRLLDELAPGGPSGKGAWTRQTLSRLFPNRAYLGEARQGEHKNGNGHPAIVDVETFDIVQAIADRAERRAEPTATKSLLAGLVRCAACGYAMQRSTVQRGRFVVYRCRGKSGGGGECSAPTSVMLPAVDELVERAFLARVEAELADDVLEPVAESLDLTDLHARIATVRAKRDRWRDPNYATALDPAEWREGFDAIEAELAELEVELEAAVPKPNTTRLEAESILDAWPHLSTADRRELLKAEVEAVVISRGPSRRSPIADRLEVRWIVPPAADEVDAGVVSA